MKRNNIYLEEIASVFNNIGNSIKMIHGEPVIPSEVAIYRYLETYAYAAHEVGIEIHNEQKKIIRYAIESRDVSAYERNLSTIKGGYTTISNRAKFMKEVSYNDAIWLHFSLLTDSLVDVSRALIDFMNDRGISYALKVPEKTGPDSLVLGVYSKEIAEHITSFCGTNEMIKESLMINNPFMPHQNGVGVVKEAKGRSYTHQVAYLLHKYYKHIMGIMNETKTTNADWGTLNHFLSYVTEQFELSRKESSIFERYLNYQIVLGLNCIKQEANYLDYVEHLKPIQYDRDKFESYRLSYKNNIFEYNGENEEVINEQNNYLLWLELQAYNTIQRIYYEQYLKTPKENGILTYEMMVILSRTADEIMAGNYHYTPLNYNDTMIASVFPCLVAYNAYKHKMATPSEARYIEGEVRGKVVNKSKTHDPHKKNYIVGNQPMPSTIPLIKIPGCLISIEYLDYTDNFCNIYIQRNGKTESYTSVFLDNVDKEKIWEEKVFGASLYRAALARILSDFNNIGFQKLTRNHKTGRLLLIGDVMKTKLRDMPVYSLEQPNSQK